MKWLLVVSFSSVFFLSDAQSRFNYSLDWHAGSVVLESGDTVNCKVRYNTSLPEGIVQVLDGENIRSLSIKDVAAFSYHDDAKNKNRKFQRFEIKEGQFEGRIFFCELLYKNPRFTILKHRALGTAYEHMNYTRFLKKHTMVSQKYILDEPTGRVLMLSPGNALSLMGEKKTEISTFIHDNGIKFKSLADYVKVLDFHSSL